MPSEWHPHLFSHGLSTYLLPKDKEGAGNDLHLTTSKMPNQASEFFHPNYQCWLWHFQ